MMLLRLLTDQHITPELRPSAILLLMSRGIKLPKLSRPKTPRPEISLLLLPLPGHIIRFREETLAGIWADRLRVRLKNRLPLQCGAVDSLAQEFHCLLHRLCFAGNQSIWGRRLACS